MIVHENQLKLYSKQYSLLRRVHLLCTSRILEDMSYSNQIEISKADFYIVGISVNFQNNMIDEVTV